MVGWLKPAWSSDPALGIDCLSSMLKALGSISNLKNKIWPVLECLVSIQNSYYNQPFWSAKLLLFFRVANDNDPDVLQMGYWSSCVVTQEIYLPVGRTWIVAWDGPLVGTPDGWRGGAGRMGCNGRDMGWEVLTVDEEGGLIFLGSVN